jgi:hypothetical protein
VGYITPWFSLVPLFFCLLLTTSSLWELQVGSSNSFEENTDNWTRNCLDQELVPLQQQQQQFLHGKLHGC